MSDAAPGRSTHGAAELRVAVMNAESGAGTTRGWWEYFSSRRRRPERRRERIRRIGRALREARVDVAIVLEIDCGSKRTSGIDQSRLLAEEGGFAGAAFFGCFRAGSRIHQGNAVYAVGSVEPVANHRLPGLGEPRFLSHARARHAGTEIHVFAAHVSLKAAVRRAQLEEIRRIVARRDGALVLGGDFNARRSAELDALSTALHRVPAGPTFPSWRPRWSLDQLLVSRHFAPRAVRVLDRVREADHLPLVVDLELSARHGV